MKRLTKLSMVGVMVMIALLSTAITLYAMGEHGGGRGPGGHGSGPGRGRMNGEVTAVTSDTVTIVKSPLITDSHHLTHSHPLTTNGSITTVANVVSTTVVQLIECQCTGTLSDVTVGKHVDVQGTRNRDGTITATKITVAPDGVRLAGKVTAINGESLALQGCASVTGTLVTDANTKFFTRDSSATFADITIGTRVAGYGAVQSDGSLLASVVLIHSAKPTTTTLTTSTESAATDALVADLLNESTEATALQTTFLPLIKR